MEDSLNNDLRLCFAEALGTFILVFAGTGAMIVNGLYGGIITHVGVAIAWGLVVMTVIYAFGDVSGAHVNPAVTVGFWLARRFPASLVLSLLFANSSGLGMTVPSGPAIQSFVVEIILTFYLMFVILSVATGSKEKGVMAGCAIGAVVGLEALFAGPVSGASMNPARSLAPALASMRLEYLWIYLTAPFIGSSLAVAAFHLVRTARPQEG